MVYISEVDTKVKIEEAREIMRRKSERTSGRKSKTSPEKKVEKVKRTRGRRKKQSTSSENESPDEASPVREEVVVESDKKPPSTPVKEDSPEEAQDQVWRVKAPESADGGEIQKLKICLTRPPSTPERADRSPRSKRKHSRATSSSDATSGDAADDRKKSKHRSKRAHRDSKDELERNQDSHGEDQETENEAEQSKDTQENENEVSQSDPDQPQTTEATISTTNENPINESGDSSQTSEDNTNTVTEMECKSDADTTVASPKSEAPISTLSEIPVSETIDQGNITVNPDKVVVNEDIQTDKPDKSVNEPENSNENLNQDKINEVNTTEKQDHSYKKHDDTSKDISMEKQDNSVEKLENSSDKEANSEEKQDNSIEKLDNLHENEPDTSVEDASMRDRSESIDKSEILELHPDESRIEISDVETSKVIDPESMEEQRADEEQQVKVSISRETAVSNEKEARKDEKIKDNNESGVVENDNDEKELRKPLADAEHDKDTEKSEVHREPLEIERQNSKESDKSVSTPTQENVLQNGQAPPLVVNRKRRWGARPKITTQKSITISTEVLKEIIPDVKPVAFDEVIEEKKHRRVEVPEKIQRPVLPKIVIDNTENVEQNRKDIEAEERDKENIKSKESNLASNRKISIVKDNDILARPPSPPKHKQSSILYITNLVRPFTLPQLKNLLQRTGKIMENGFWIDRIKSKCFVQYENEDQAIETRHALHGVKWPVSNPKTLQVDFSTLDAFDKAKSNEDADNAQTSTIPSTMEDWLREQDQKRERGEPEKPWERKAAMREWDVGKNDKDNKDREKIRRDERPPEKRRHRTPERSPEPARKFKKKEEEAPAKLLDDLFRKTKTTPCIYWLPLSAETIAIKEEQRRQHMAEYERRMQEQRRPQRRH